MDVELLSNARRLRQEALDVNEALRTTEAGAVSQVDLRRSALADEERSKLQELEMLEGEIADMKKQLRELEKAQAQSKKLGSSVEEHLDVASKQMYNTMLADDDALFSQAQEDEILQQIGEQRALGIEITRAHQHVLSGKEQEQIDVPTTRRARNRGRGKARTTSVRRYKVEGHSWGNTFGMEFLVKESSELTVFGLEVEVCEALQEPLRPFVAKCEKDNSVQGFLSGLAGYCNVAARRQGVYRAFAQEYGQEVEYVESVACTQMTYMDGTQGVGLTMDWTAEWNEESNGWDEVVDCWMVSTETYQAQVGQRLMEQLSAGWNQMFRDVMVQCEGDVLTALRFLVESVRGERFDE